MTSFFHSIRGRYSIEEKFVGIDYGNLFLKPHEAEATLTHELSHGVIATFDFGQATNNIMGMHWDIDWIESMVDGKILYFRK